MKIKLYLSGNTSKLWIYGYGTERKKNVFGWQMHVWHCYYLSNLNSEVSFWEWEIKETQSCSPLENMHS